MEHDALLNIVKNNNIIIPLYIYKEFPKLNIDYETFIFLMFLYSKGNKIPFDINKLREEFFTDNKKIMQYVSNLQNSKLIDIKVIKNDRNISEEYIYLDYFYEKISLCLVNNEVVDEKEEEKNDIFDILQKDVGLQLSFVEVEIVKAWNYDKEVIKEAINEAVKNKVASIRYIDKILYSWAKKGIKTKEDVEKNRKNFRAKEEKQEKIDVFDYDWMEDDE